eukprot:CAMPEP_0175797820 /NCGR_PEP_ID=MMETSP0097-20121207/85663_1 /TAXON_ID=311494 /ORGANISM="Alexandrium monilatum, Strain CCMP3105" /LENGTH=197 /DNA_ID=CAMNT_0017109019 /DNA_START=62 /DNA_END=652 /DNA_ORIENTATION=-
MSANRRLLASCGRQLFRACSKQQALDLARRPAVWAPTLRTYPQRWASTTSPPSMEEAVSEQQQVLFPRLKELEEARQREDLQRRATNVPTEQWSPRQVPYKVYEKSTSADSDDDEDSDAEDEEEASLETLRADSSSTDGLQVGMDETGFRYAGPEPTLYGDWAHKGRVTDFDRPRARTHAPLRGGTHARMQALFRCG